MVDEDDQKRVGFLDANLVFAREAQVYLLGLQAQTVDAALHGRMAGAYEFYLAGVEAALGDSTCLVGDRMSIADISFACDFAQFLREGHYAEYVKSCGLDLISEGGSTLYPRSFQHMFALSEREEFAELKRYLRWYRQAA